MSLAIYLTGKDGPRGFCRICGKQGARAGSPLDDHDHDTCRRLVLHFQAKAEAELAAVDERARLECGDIGERLRGELDVILFDLRKPDAVAIHRKDPYTEYLRKPDGP